MNIYIHALAPAPSVGFRAGPWIFSIEHTGHWQRNETLVLRQNLIGDHATTYPDGLAVWLSAAREFGIPTINGGADDSFTERLAICIH